MIDLYIELKGMNDFRDFLDYLKDNQIKVAYVERNKLDFMKDEMIVFL